MYLKTKEKGTKIGSEVQVCMRDRETSICALKGVSRPSGVRMMRG